MTIKTLKDIELISHQNYFKNKRKVTPLEDWDNSQMVLINELKQEAISWIKKLQVKLDNEATVGDRSTTYSAQIVWIKHFFNISEEELV